MLKLGLEEFSHKYQEFLRRSNEERLEFIDGEIFPLGAQPSIEHSEGARWVLHFLNVLFGKGGGGPKGWWFFQETEVRMLERTFRPDIIGIRKEHCPGFERPHKGRILTLIPDWICEVVSEFNPNHDWGRKMKYYAESGVSFYWILDPRPDNQRLVALELENKVWKLLGTFTKEDVAARIHPFEEGVLDVSTLFFPEDGYEKEK